MSNTLKTVWGFIISMLAKYTPIKIEGKTLDRIYNYLPIDESLVTSGQPSERQFEMIQAAGFQHVVNLAPHQAENSLPDEAGLLAGMGITYTHIPVDFKDPTDADYAEFVQTLNGLREQKVWVHCAANMRVSAFMYRYRTSELGVAEAQAQLDLHKIWEPYGVWRAFIASK